MGQASRGMVKVKCKKFEADNLRKNFMEKKWEENNLERKKFGVGKVKGSLGQLLDGCEMIGRDLT